MVAIGGEAFGERAGLGINVQLLSDLAHLSGGVINPTPKQILGRSRTTENQTHLFEPLALLAFFVVLLEAFFRELGFGFIGALMPNRSKRAPSELSHRPIGDYGTLRSRSVK